MQRTPDGEIAIGLGFQRGVTRAGLESAIISALRPLPGLRIRRIATLSAKCTEPGLLELVRAHHWVLIGYPAARLATIDGLTHSATAKNAVGTPSVAEAAALLASAHAQLLLPRQIHRGDDKKAVTLAAALMHRTHPPRPVTRAADTAAPDACR